MTSDLDIYRSANELIKQYGDAADIEAAMHNIGAKVKRTHVCLGEDPSRALGCVVCGRVRQATPRHRQGWPRRMHYMLWFAPDMAGIRPVSALT